MKFQIVQIDHLKFQYSTIWQSTKSASTMIKNCLWKNNRRCSDQRNDAPVTPDDFGMQKRSNFINLFLIFILLIFVITAYLFYFKLKINPINQFVPPSESPININH